MRRRSSNKRPFSKFAARSLTLASSHVCLQCMMAGTAMYLQTVAAPDKLSKAKIQNPSQIIPSSPSTLLPSHPMPEIVPALLVPYFQEALIQSSSTLVTSTLSTPASWVLVRLLYSAFKAVDQSTSFTATKQQNATTSANVIFASLTKPVDLWIELCKKVVSQVVLPCPFVPLRPVLLTHVRGSTSPL